jgi:hypothetical protein
MCQEQAVPNAPPEGAHVKRLRNIIVGTLGVVVALVGAQPALAGLNTHVVTPRGSAWFGHFGDLVKACDRKPDGWGVRAVAARPDGRFAIETDTFGHGCTSHKHFKLFHEGQRIRLVVCLFKSVDGKMQVRCSRTVTGRA